MHDAQKIEAELSRQLFRLINHFNRLEYNLGLSLSFLLSPANAMESYTAISKMSLDSKLRKFVRAVQEQVTIPDNVDLESWMVKVDEAGEYGTSLCMDVGRYCLSGRKTQ